MDIYPLSSTSASHLIDNLTWIYCTVFSQPPYSEPPSVLRQFQSSIRSHLGHAGFACVVAQKPESRELVGFCYGYTAQPGQWWHDTVTRDLPQVLVENWFSDAFELVDLALIPEEQGKGVGGQLLDTLTGSLPHRTAVLSTIRTPTDAFHLYQKRGWQILNPNLDFPSIKRPYMLMGKELQS